ncbi:MAG: phosphate signaling complex protein PhoU [Planctomycetota bacterium]
MMLHHGIEELQERMARMAARVTQSVERAVRAVIDGDPGLVKKIHKADARIDVEEVAVEKQAINLLALFQPAATDLRLLTTIIKANADFERIGDCAVNIARNGRPLIKARDNGEDVDLPPSLRELAAGAEKLLGDAVRAFNLQDEMAAQDVIDGDERLDALYHDTVQSMLARMPTDTEGLDQAGKDRRMSQDFSIILIAKSLERIGDHCTNIAEDVIYIASGEIVRHRRGG